MSEHIIVHDDGAVRAIRIHRPDKKNALTGAMYAAMAEAIAEGNARTDTRCLLITGAPGAFTAGNDLGDFLRVAETGGTGDRPAQGFLMALARNVKPLVAGVQGVAVGVGTTLLLHCDYVVAGTDARFSTPFIRLGILPEAASTLLGPRLMGDRRAFELLVMGRPFDAERARAVGLANDIVDPAEVDAAARNAADEIAALPPEAVRIARELMRGDSAEVVARIAHEAELFTQRLASPEAKAAFAAFLDRKR